MKTARRRALHVLWVDDDIGDVAGFGAHLRHSGHEVVMTPKVDEAETLLRTEPFDLLIVDQKMRSDEEAGTRLVGRLKDLELGDLNVNVHFGFFTGSDEWVYSSHIDVGGYQGYLGVEEKGENFEDWLELKLSEIAVKDDPPRDADIAADHEPRASPASERGTIDPADELEASWPGSTECWDGVVLDVEDDAFFVRLEDQTGRFGAHEARLPIDAIALSARQKLAVGARLEWRLVAEDDGNRRVIRSQIELSPVEVLDEKIVAAALQEARRLRQEL